MAAYTPSLRLTLPVTGTDDGTWGDTVNNGITSLTDAAIAGTATVIQGDVANYTLTSNSGATDQARNMFLNITGALTAARNVICPTASKLYFIKNSTTGGFAVTLKTAAGTGISVPAGSITALYCDGTNVVDAITYANIPVINATTVDTTNLEVTNIKAKDGTASITLADTTGIATFSKATVISTSDATNAALRVTQTGAGNAFVVEDAANPDASPFVIDPAGVVLAGFTTAPAGSYKAYISGTAFATGAWRVGDNTDGSTSGYFSNTSNTTKSIQIAADPDNLGASSIIALNIDGTEKARFDSSGRFFLGSTSASAAGIKNSWNLTGGTTAYGNLVNGTIQSDVTGNANLVTTIVTTAAAVFNITNLRHFYATSSAFGAGSTVTNQYGFLADSTLSGATNNYGFYSAVPAATGDWNFYAAGTATNYFAGSVGIGTTAPLTTLNVNGTGGELLRISVTSDALVQQEPALGFAMGVTNVYPATKISALEFDVSDARASMLFYTRGVNTDSAPTEAMRITSAQVLSTTNDALIHGLTVGTGAGALSTNTAVGTDALKANTTGIGNVAIGSETLQVNTIGDHNAALGQAALYSNTTGIENTALGQIALYSNISGVANTAVGNSALFNSTGNYNTAVGAQAGYYISTGANNTILGRFDGNQGGLDIRTASNYIVLSDGAGNPRIVVNSAGSVGINTVAPTSTLSVTGTFNATANVTLGDATTDTVTVNGYMGVGGASASTSAINITSTALTGTSQNGVVSNFTSTAASTTAVTGVLGAATTISSAFTTANLSQFRAQNTAKGALSTVTNMHGLYIEALTQGTNNFGITSLVASGTGRWNVYASGTASNAFAGSVRIGSVVAPTVALDVTGAMTVSGNSILGDATTDTVTVNGYMAVGGAVSATAGVYVRSTALTGINQYGVYTTPVGTSAATSSINGITTAPATAAAAFTATAVYGLRALNATKGAGSTIASLYGISIDDQTQGTNNYGLVSAVSSGTNKWNIYAIGTASNYFAGDVVISTTTPSSSCQLTVAGGISSVNGGLNTSGTGGFFNGASKFGVDNNAGASRLYSSGANSTTKGSFEFHATDSVGTLDTIAMQLDVAGNLLVGTATNPQVTKLALQYGGTNVWGVGPNSGSATFYVINSAGTGVSLSTGSTSWAATSDERLKTALTPFENAAAKICTLRAGTGRYLTDENTVSRSFLIAQDVQAVLPEAVDVGVDEQKTLSLKYTEVMPLLVAAIQEQQALITALTDRITALEAK